MDDLPCGSERVPVVADSTSSITMDDTVLLEEALPPAGKTLSTGGELHHSLVETRKQGGNVDSLDTEVDISGSISLGIKKGKGDDGNSHVVSKYSESKEPFTYERSLSFPPMLRLISAMKGGREKSGEASPTENRRVKWAPDVYDPPVTSVSHSVKSHQQRPRSRKDKNKKKQKQKQKGRSRGNLNGKKSGHDAIHNPPALQAPGSSPGELGELETEILDYGMSGQEAKCGSSFLHESAAQMRFSAAEAS